MLQTNSSVPQVLHTNTGIMRVYQPQTACVSTINIKHPSTPTHTYPHTHTHTGFQDQGWLQKLLLAELHDEASVVSLGLVSSRPCGSIPGL